MQDSSSFRLIVRRGPQPNQVYELTQGTIAIGRDITNDIVINDPEVSRHHCRLTRGGGGYTVEDLGSTNGTFVNGQRLTGARPLSHGDTLGMGETVTLAYEAAAAAAQPAAPQQAPTMAGPQPGGEYAPQPQPYEYGAQPQQPGAYPGTPPPQQYGAQPQQPMGYDYDYQDEAYETGGPGRWVVLGCGCFLVLCIVSSVIGGIIIDAKCWWDDIPVISDTFDLGVKPDATCR